MSINPIKLIEEVKMFEDRIVIDPEIRHGKPIIKGTRVPVEVILGSLAGGMEIREIASEYGIKKEDVQAAIARKYIAKGVTEKLIIEYYRKGYSVSRIAENIDVPIARVMDVLSGLNEESDIEKTLEEIEISSSDDL